MAQLKYRKNELIQLEFGLDIEGTNHIPEEVKLIVIHGQKHYAVVATPNDSKYKVEFDLDTIKDLDDDSKLDLIIQVEIKGRIFKPFKRQIGIIDYTEVENISAAETNQKIDTIIQNTEIHEEKKIEKPEEEIKEETPKIISVWAKDILTNANISTVETEFSDVIKDILKGKNINQKVTVKFDKSKPQKKERKNQPKPYEIIPIEEIPFNPKVVKKKISKRKVQEAFIITEGKIKYL